MSEPDVMEKLLAAMPPPPSRYRPLAIFWTIVAAVVVGGGVTLQLMGPPPGHDHAPAVKPPPPVAAKPPPPPLPDLIPAPDPALLEPAPEFAGRFLPIKGPNGRLPLAVYKAPFNAADKHPRVVLVIDGVGLVADLSMHVLDDLPGAVDVAFYPDVGDDLGEKLAAEARRTGHECLQSVPMEPNNFPMSDEGARQLMESHDSETNRQNLEFALSRFGGCVGATGASDGLMGERFAQNGLGFSQVLEEVGKRGLLYLDARTGAPALNSEVVTPFAVVDLVIDQAPSPEQPLNADLIDQRLAALEKLATERGSAIGLAGPPQPVMLERIAVWAHGLAARGVTLAPLTAVLVMPKPVPDEGAN